MNRREALTIAAEMAGEELQPKSQAGLNLEKLGTMFTRRGQLETFWQQQPYYYDSSKIFYLWDKNNYRWIISDEVDFCNLINLKLKIDTLEHKAKTEIVEGFKQIGRKHKPEPFKKTWVQFKDRIYDMKTGEVFEASPKYLSLNPIPWKIGESEETPTINNLFREWVAPEYVDSLYQITAYNISQNKFMQRLIALCGGGCNGKGTFVKLQYKFLGESNCVASELKNLSEDKFEPAVLYGKLLCVMGEVSHDDLKNTNQLKKLAGEDKISFQFKGKTPFTAENTATAMCLTNSLPITPDKTIGFYRKIFIIDFPNQFRQMKEDLIAKIPDAEFENLARKCLRILKELYANPVFSNEGDFDERAKRYEEHSNPIMRYVEECCDEVSGQNLPLREFTNACNDYLKSKHLRIVSAVQAGKILRDEGFQVGSRKINDISTLVILNLSIKGKTIKTIETIRKSNRFPYSKTSENLDSFNSSNGKKTIETIEEQTEQPIKCNICDTLAIEEVDSIPFCQEHANFYKAQLEAVA